MIFLQKKKIRHIFLINRENNNIKIKKIPLLGPLDVQFLSLLRFQSRGDPPSVYAATVFLQMSRSPRVCLPAWRSRLAYKMRI